MRSKPDHPPSATYANVAAHFDKMAPTYEEGSGKVGWQGPERLFGALQPYLPPSQNLNIIDLGAGTGRIGWLFKILNDKTHVTGVDISKGMLAIGVEKGRIDKTVIGSVTDLQESSDHSYDVVTSAGVLDFIDDTDSFIAEAARVLKPGGLIGITFEPTDIEERFQGHKTIRHDEKILQAQFAAHGLKIEETIRVPGIYTNFKTGQPVENVMIIGTLNTI